MIGMAVVLGVLGLLLSTVKVAQARAGLGPEWARKLVHLGMGLVTLSFPWLFRSPWPVLTLGGLATGTLLLLKHWGPARTRLGGVVDGVARRSFGEFYFPLAVALVFLLSHGDPLTYCVPVLVLTLADAAAALVGLRYGQTPYTTAEGHKSLEGSLAFFLVAFFSVHVPLLLFTATGRTETLLVSLTLALVVMLLEAIAWEGLDNVFIPIGGFFLLRLYLRLSVPELRMRLVVTTGLVVFAMALRKRATLNHAALLGAALAGYAAFAVGGPAWLAPPLILFLAYTRLSPPTPANSRRIHDIHAVVAVAGPGLVWLFLSRHGHPGYLALYAATYAAQLAFSGLARLAYDYPERSAAWLVLRCAGLGSALILLPVLVLDGISAGALRCLGWNVLGVFLASVLFWSLEPAIRDCPTTRRRWVRQGLLSLVAAVPGLVQGYRITNP